MASKNLRLRSIYSSLSDFRKYNKGGAITSRFSEFVGTLETVSKMVWDANPVMFRGLGQRKRK